MKYFLPKCLLIFGYLIEDHSRKQSHVHTYKLSALMVQLHCHREYIFIFTRNVSIDNKIHLVALMYNVKKQLFDFLGGITHLWAMVNKVFHVQPLKVWLCPFILHRCYCYWNKLISNESAVEIWSKIEIPSTIML